MNIIKLHHTFILDKKIYLIMDYAEGGELEAHLKQSKKLSELESWRIFKQICRSMSHCHQIGIIHRDLKPENVLFSDTEHTKIKVADFGIAGISKGNNAEVNNYGTLKFMPPELLSG